MKRVARVVRMLHRCNEETVNGLEIPNSAYQEQAARSSSAPEQRTGPPDASSEVGQGSWNRVEELLEEQATDVRTESRGGEHTAPIY
jgi:hypothetical protein